MKIVVLVKSAVPLTSAVKVDPKTGSLIREGVPLSVNMWDRDAVELALKLKDKYGGEVVAVSMAPPTGISGLKSLIGMGVDSALLVTDRAYARADTWATSYVLAKAVEKYVPDFDLVVAGEESTDGATGHVGAQVAYWLKLPYVYYVYDVEVKGRAAVVKRFLEDEGVEEVYELDLPAAISVLKRSQVPREVRLSYKLDAESRIKVVTNKELGLETECVGLQGSPTIIARVAESLYPPRRKALLQGQPRDVVKKLVEVLREIGVLEL